MTDPRTHLEALVFHNSPAALIALREAFKKGGMRTQERQLTYAIEHSKRLQAWNPSWYDADVNDERPWLERLVGKSESLFYWIALQSASGRSGPWMIVPTDRPLEEEDMRESRESCRRPQKRGQRAS